MAVQIRTRLGGAPLASWLGHVERIVSDVFLGPNRKHWFVVVPIVAVLAYYYAFMASAGRFHDLAGQMTYYDKMAEGFRAGHLYVVERPSPKLLAKPDPFARENFDQNLWLWDASLYKGHYYMYWGPVPGLLLLAYKTITHHSGAVSDQWPTVAFMLGRLVAGALLIVGLARSVQIRQPPWVVGLAVAVFGLCSPAPFIVARPHVYEAGLSGGQCFVFLGLFSCFYGITRPRARTGAFVLAGVFWSLALGCRATMAIAAALFVPITVFVVWLRLDRSPSRALKNALSLGTPIAIAVGAYGVYNYLRFDSPTDFGVRHQVTLQRVYTDARFVVPNIFSYLFAPAKVSCKFPFVTGMRDRHLWLFLHWPRDYQTFELVAGVMVLGSWCWLLFPALWRSIKAAFDRGWASPPRQPALSTVELWALACSAASMLSMIPALTFWEASMRYAGDAVGGMVLASTVTAFWLLRNRSIESHRIGRFSTRAALVAMGVHTCVVGALSAVAAPTDPLKSYNPALFDSLSRSLSVCRITRGHWSIAGDLLGIRRK